MWWKTASDVHINAIASLKQYSLHRCSNPREDVKREFKETFKRPKKTLIPLNVTPLQTSKHDQDAKVHPYFFFFFSFYDLKKTACFFLVFA